MAANAAHARGPSKDDVTRALFAAVDEINRQRPRSKRLAKTLDAALVGPAGALDSLGLVNLIVAAEAELERAFGASVALADEAAMARPDHPFRTLGALADFVHGRLAEGARA